MAGEFGHIALDENGPPCCCGKRGCWERFASNSAAVDYYVSGGAERAGRSAPGIQFEDIMRLAGPATGGPSRPSSAWPRFLAPGSRRSSLALPRRSLS